MEADLQSHHIEGYASISGDYFSVPLISEFGAVLGGVLHHGGCAGGVDVRGMFDVIVSLYPWAKYLIDERTERHEFRMYDSHDGADSGPVLRAADVVGESLRAGKTVLVHCQAGLNRSSLVVGTMLVLCANFTPDDAIRMIRERRSPACLCNSSFEQFVRDLA